MAFRELCAERPRCAGQGAGGRCALSAPGDQLPWLCRLCWAGDVLAQPCPALGWVNTHSCFLHQPWQTHEEGSTLS